MTDHTSHTQPRRTTRLYFLVGLLVALVLVPVLALAATTSPAAVQDSTSQLGVTQP
jgi:hypothetical protein